MALHPPPTIENHLCLITQPLTHSAVGRTAELTFAVFNSTGLTVQTIANNVQSHMNNDLKSLFDDNVIIQKLFARLGDGSTTPTIAIASGATVTGTRAGITATPPNISTLIRKNSTVGGKKNRGRIYCPWTLATADVSEAGVITAGIVTTMQTAWSAFLTHLGTDPNAMVIANKTLAVDPGTGKSYVTAITAGPTMSSLTVETSIATQRRRLVRQ